MNTDPTKLHTLLKQYFGFSTFRPLQEQIIGDALAGKDVFALLPTGGGKSLCFQLPALLLPGLTLVVSPLIALMKDQVDALQASGVAATYLNSSITTDEARERYQKLNRGEYRLLYVAPERLMLGGFLEDLHRWKVNLFAIDEAHCISEWGHDFRPEYRQLAKVRSQYPGIPVMALTATATERVREDIVKQLQLRDTEIYVASFNRPNLTYRITPKAGSYEQITGFIQGRKGESGIIYCQARKTADSLAARLNEDGIRAASYHAGLEGKERARNQEAFLRDEVRVVCATIAFGMGINKPNVRFVIHHDLPKNVESYYQETGRAGRDGLPSECLLLYSAGDRVKYSQFIDEKPDPKERELARAQLEQIVHYAEEGRCRREYLLNYFGESFRTGDSDEVNCGSCDNCISPRQTWDGTVAAQKFLSCVYRVQQKSQFSVGINHIVEVLTGASTEKVRKFGHQELTTYNIGKEHDRSEWSAIGRELVRLGLLKQNAEKFNVLEVTRAGHLALKERRKITLTRSVATPEKKKVVGDIGCDEALFESLRELRKRLADEQLVPPYIVFSDVSLRQMARFYPENEQQFARISGVGERKLREYGEMFLGAIREHLAKNPRQIFADDSFQPVAAPKRSLLTNTVVESLRLHKAGKSVEEIARMRGFVPGTIYNHLTSAFEAGEKLNLEKILSKEAQHDIAAAFAQFGFGNLTGAIESLGDRYSPGEFRLYRVVAQRKV